MRLTLWTRSEAGTQVPRIVLRSGQTATIGRTENADVVIPDDAQISSVHFSVEASPQACHVRDLKSRNGTFLNGQRVSQSLLGDGDTLRAGTTEFRVHVEFDTGALVPSQLAPAVAKPRAPAEPAASPLPAAQPTPAPSRPRGRGIESVSLVVQSPAHSLKKIWVRPGQQMTLGSNQQADAVLSGDNRISRIHATLECTREVCRVSDFQSTNGTFVNGERVQEAALHNGDQLMLGETAILVEIHYEPQAEGAPSSLHSYAVQPVPCGAKLYVPVEPRDAIADLPYLARSTRLDVVLVTNHREAFQLGGQALHEWTSRSPMLTGPILVCGDTAAHVTDIVRETWAKGTCFCLLARVEPQLLLAGLRLLARGQTRPTEIPNLERLWADATPKTLVPQLANGPREVADKLFSLVDAILAPGDPPASWRALGTNRFAIALAEAGLVPEHKSA